MSDQSETNEFIAGLFEDLDHYKQLTEACFGDLSTWDACDRMMFYGRQYHKTADNIHTLTGIDPRPPAERGGD